MEPVGASRHKSTTSAASRRGATGGGRKGRAGRGRADAASGVDRVDRARCSWRVGGPRAIEYDGRWQPRTWIRALEPALPAP